MSRCSCFVRVGCAHVWVLAIVLSNVNILIAGGVPESESDSGTRQRFLREYPAAARRIEKVYDNIKMTSKVDMYYPDVTVHEDRIYWAADGAVRCDTKRQRSIQPGYEEADVRVTTPNTSFVLTKNSKQGSDKYRIGHLGSGATKGEPPRSQVRAIGAPTSFFLLPIAEFIKEPKFVLEKVEEEERDGRSVVVVSWSSPFDDRKKRWGKFVFDAKSWVVLETSLNLQGAHLFENGKPDDKVLLERVLTYRDEVDGIPILSKIEDFGNPKTGRRLNEVEEITSFVQEAAPPEHFSLAAFGMNARVVSPRRTGLYVLIGLAVLASALFALLRVARNKLQKA